MNRQFRICYKGYLTEKWIYTLYLWEINLEINFEWIYGGSPFFIEWE